MHSSSAALACRVFLVLPALATLASAAEPAAPVPQGGEAPITLSPFTVTAGSEVGYVATSSLAGSRLSTPLKNIASQIDVMTPEFLSDIGAVNLTDALEFSSNTGGANQQNAGPNSSSDDVRNEGRARGFDAVTISSDFFATGLPSDFYNVERLTIANGPQSVLFGLGNAGGVLDVTTKKAQMKNAYSLEFRADAEGSLRSVADVNQMLVKQRLAVRLVGLRGRENEFIDGGYKDSNRLFGSATWQPRRTTTVRASAERASLKLSAATNFVSQNFVGPWVNAGRPLYDNSRGNLDIVNASNPIFSRNATIPRIVSYDPSGVLTVRSWNGAAVTKGPHQQAGVVDNRDRSLVDGSIFPTDADPRVASRLNDIDGWVLRGTIEHQLAENLFLEVGANYEKRREMAGGLFNPAEGINILGDPNRFLPGGTAAAPQTAANPNVGRLYIEALPNGTERQDITREGRLSLSYEFDFAKKMQGGTGRLGRHRLVGLFSQREDRSLSQANRGMVVGNTSFTSGDALNNTRTIRMRYYLDPARGNTGAGALQDSVFGPWTFSDAPTGQTFETRLFNHPAGSSGVVTGNRAEVLTQMLAVQSDFWRERVNLFFGFRSDAVEVYDVAASSNVRQDLAVAGDRQGLYRNLRTAHFAPTALSDTTGRSKSYGAVVHPLPWLSVFFSQSQNYALPPGYRGPDDVPLPGTYSDGRDYGIRAEFWSGKLSARLNFYEETQNANFGGPIQALRDYAAEIENRLRGSNAPNGIRRPEADGFDPVARGVHAYRATEYKFARGFDLTVLARPLPNWDVRFAGGRQLTKVAGKAENFAQWIESRVPVWQDAGGLGWSNVTISPTDSRSIRQYYNDVVLAEMESNRIRNNLLRFRQREWRSTLFTNYRFTSEPLKGFSVGGGVRWLSKALIGFEQSRLPNGAIEDDVTRPLYNAPLFHLDALLGYGRPFTLMGQRLRWHVQLNVRNVLDDHDLERIRAARDGSILDYARTPGRQFILTTRFSY